MKSLSLLSFLLLICSEVLTSPDTISQKSENSEQSEVDICAICLDPLNYQIQDKNDGQYVVSLSCHTTHSFHKQCICEVVKYDRELLISTGPTCPYCKTKISTEIQNFVTGGSLQELPLPTTFFKLRRTSVPLRSTKHLRAESGSDCDPSVEVPSIELASSMNLRRTSRAGLAKSEAIVSRDEFQKSPSKPLVSAGQSYVVSTRPVRQETLASRWYRFITDTDIDSPDKRGGPTLYPDISLLFPEI